MQSCVQGDAHSRSERRRYIHKAISLVAVNGADSLGDCPAGLQMIELSDQAVDIRLLEEAVQDHHARSPRSPVQAFACGVVCQAFDGTRPRAEEEEEHAKDRRRSLHLTPLLRTRTRHSASFLLTPPSRCTGVRMASAHRRRAARHPAVCCGCGRLVQ